MSHTYHQLYFHFVWGTRLRQPMIDRNWRPQLLHILNEEIKKRGGHPIRHNVMPDHVHLLARLTPKIAPADFIGQVKGATAYRVNREINPRFKLSWQDGYGVMSLRKDELGLVSNYIDRQEAHHRNRKVSALLETMNVEEDECPSESEMAEADGASPVNRAE
jgi:putative transposase